MEKVEVRETCDVAAVPFRNQKLPTGVVQGPVLTHRIHSEPSTSQVVQLMYAIGRVQALDCGLLAFLGIYHAYKLK